ncbi:MAG: hypothetical protein UV52_C0002G0019, partial [Parcubacteria group bacterium GW2011_GWD1_42_9]
PAEAGRSPTAVINATDIYCYSQALAETWLPHN